MCHRAPLPHVEPGDRVPRERRRRTRGACRPCRERARSPAERRFGAASPRAHVAAEGSRRRVRRVLLHVPRSELVHLRRGLAVRQRRRRKRRPEGTGASRLTHGLEHRAASAGARRLARAEPTSKRAATPRAIRLARRSERALDRAASAGARKAARSARVAHERAPCTRARSRARRPPVARKGARARGGRWATRIARLERRRAHALLARRSALGTGASVVARRRVGALGWRGPVVAARADGGAEHGREADDDERDERSRGTEVWEGAHIVGFCTLRA